MKVAVIADDLTGASDTGVQFAKLGLKTLVVLSTHALQSLDPQGIDALVVNTDSRALPQEDAYTTVAKVSQILSRFKPDLVYKKIDSTLRGNLASEIQAVMDQFHHRFALVAPAFPKNGRTTQGGRHFVHGIPISETEMARDPRAPVHTSELAALLTPENGRKAKNLLLSDWQKGKEHVKMLLASSDESVIWACDAVTDQDLEKIADIGSQFAPDVLLVGSAGLAEFLPHAMRWVSGSLKANESFFPVVDGKEKGRTGPSLLVAGSMSQMTMQQVEYIRQTLRRVRVFAVSARELVQPFFQDQFEVIQNEVSEQLQKGQPAVIVLAGEKIPGQSEIIALHLGEFVRELLNKVSAGSLILTGGDIASAVCKCLEVVGVQVLTELEVGIPFGQIVGGPWHGLPVVTKAGAFGQIESLARILSLLNGKEI